MKLNPNKCFLLLRGKEDKATNVRNLVIKNPHNEKLLGVFFEGNASFGYRIQNTCIKTSRKIQALTCITPCMDLSV